MCVYELLASFILFLEIMTCFAEEYRSMLYSDQFELRHSEFERIKVIDKYDFSV